MKSFTSIPSVVALSLCLAGCGETVVIGEGAPDPKCGLAPRSTIELLGEQMIARGQAIVADNSCMEKYQQHLQELKDQGVCTEENCWKLIGKEAKVCSYQYAVTVNEPTVTRCGAQVLVVPKGVLPEEYVMNFEQQVDTDGDGVSNYDEYEGFSDPCTANSVDVCKSDGELDYDEDGLPNDSDQYPSCPGLETPAC